MEQKLIATIRNKIINSPANSAWDRGVRTYALEIFDNYIEEHNSNKQITEKDLLNGASNWSEYSWDGCAEIYDEDICKRLSTPSEQKKTRYGELKPNPNEEWLDVQARALYQAAQIVLSIVNESIHKPTLKRMSFSSL